MRRSRRPTARPTTAFARACRRITLAASLATASLCSPHAAPAAPPEHATPEHAPPEHATSAARSRVASVELRADARVNDASVTLRQLCRWSDADEATLAPYADLIVLRLPPGGSVGTIGIEQLQSTLGDAGLNAGNVDFAGATSCTVSRADLAADDAAALRAYSGAAEPAPTLAESSKPTLAKPTPQGDDAPAAEVHDLRSLLIADVAQRLKLPIDTLQLDFRPEDRATLSMAAPFEFSIQPQRYGDLGETSWLIAISGRGAKPASNVGDGRRIRIAATARAWMDQVVATHALATRAPITAADVDVKHVLVDRMPSDPWVTKDQAVGQETARDVRPGTVLSSRLVAPVELVRPGQLVTVFMRRGTIEVKCVARAMQSGSAGQAVKLKNESTGEMYLATITAKQTAVIEAGTVADAR